MKDKVSIIVALYNSEKFIVKLVDSIINQTYKNIEIILVDDGSPDNCGKICDDYAKKDSRIKVIHKKNGGVSSARNAGIDIMTGDYMTIVDGDDWLSSDFVEYMMKLIKVNNSDMAFSYNLFTSRNQIQVKKDHIKEISSTDAILDIIYPKMIIGPWNKIYSTKIIKQYNIKFDVQWFGEGIYFSTNFAKHSKSITVGERKVYNYRLNNENSGTTNYKIEYGYNALNNILSTKKMLNSNNKKINNAIDWHIWKNYNFLLLQIIGSNKKKLYIDDYKKCLNYIRKNMLKVFMNSELPIKEKFKIIIRGLFPVLYNKCIIFYKKYSIKRDKMN